MSTGPTGPVNIGAILVNRFPLKNAPDVFGINEDDK